MKIASLSAALVMLGFSLAAVISPIDSAPAQQFTSAVTPLLDAAAGKTVGSLAPGAALDVVGQSGSATHVTLHGWYAAGSTAIVYGFPDKHVVTLSGFTGHATAGAAQAVTVDGWVATNALVADVQTVWKAAAALYAQKCSQCHALQPVNSYSANQWPAIMKAQQDNAALDPGQAALILTYLQIQSGH
jgi:hypothetical protein